MPPFTRLVIPADVHAAVVAHARAELPNECCGALAGLIDGDTGRVTQHFPVRNDLASPTEYATNALDLMAAFRATHETGTELLAMYHSHPTSDPVPSRKDLDRNTYGETVVHLIIGLVGEPEVRGWWLAETEFRPAEVEIT